MPSRIAIIQPEMPHYRVGFFEALAERRDYDLTLMHSGKPRRIEKRNLREVVLPAAAVGSFRWQRGLLQQASAFDVVVAAFDPHWISTVLLVLLRRAPRLVLWGHGLGRREWLAPLRMALARRAHAMIFYDDSSAERFARMGIPVERLFTAWNTIAVPNHGRNESTARDAFVFVGRLQKRKRVEELLRAFAEARSRLPAHIGLLIVGDGTERARLERLANELQISTRVSFLGETTSDDQLREVFDRAIAYVSPGSVGLGVLHSFAHGVPVVTRRDVRHAPEVGNVLDGTTGMYFEGGAGGLAALLIRLASEPALAARLGRRAHELYANERQVTHMVAGFCRALDFVLTQ